MRTIRVVVIGVLALVGTAGTAGADGFLTPYVGVNFGGDSSNCASLTTCEEKRSNFGISFGSMGSVLGFEVDFAYARDFFGKVPDAESSVFSWMNSALVGVGTGPVQPYVLVGLGLIRPRTSLKFAQIAEFTKHALGYDLGGGVQVYFSRHVGVRGDVRHLRTAQDVPIFKALTNEILSNEELDFWRSRIGITFR